MKVRAIATGFYGGQLRQPGSEFVLTPLLVTPKDGKVPYILPPEDQFSHVWMVRLDGPPPERKRKGSWEETLKMEEEQANKALERAIKAGVEAGLQAAAGGAQFPPQPGISAAIIEPPPPPPPALAPEEPTGAKQVI